MNVLKAIYEFVEGIGAILLAVAMAIILFIAFNIRIILIILFCFVLVKYFL